MGSGGNDTAILRQPTPYARLELTRQDPCYIF